MSQHNAVLLLNAPKNGGGTQIFQKINSLIEYIELEDVRNEEYLSIIYMDGSESEIYLENDLVSFRTKGVRNHKELLDLLDRAEYSWRSKREKSEMSNLLLTVKRDILSKT